MKIIAAIIGMGIGEKHIEAIDNYKFSNTIDINNASTGITTPT